MRQVINISLFAFTFTFCLTKFLLKKLLFWFCSVTYTSIHLCIYRSNYFLSYQIRLFCKRILSFYRQCDILIMGGSRGGTGGPDHPNLAKSGKIEDMIWLIHIKFIIYVNLITIQPEPTTSRNKTSKGIISHTGRNNLPYHQQGINAIQYNTIHCIVLYCIALIPC